MKDALDFSGEGRQLRQSILERIALMNDAVEPQLHRHIHLLAEQFRLAPLPAFKISVVVFPVVIQARFANGDDFGMLRQFAQRRADILRGFQNMVWMNADGRIDIGEFLRNLNGEPAGGQISADGDYFGDPIVMRAPDDLREVRLEIGKPEVRVSVVKNRHAKSKSRKRKAEMEGQNACEVWDIIHPETRLKETDG